MKTLNRLAPALIVATLAGALAVPAEASRCREVDAAFAQAEAQMERAERNLRECSVPEAKALVQSAFKNFKRGREEAGRGNCRRAQLMLEAAVKLARRAADVCQEGDRHRERLGQILHKTDRILGEAEVRVGADDSRECRRFLHAALQEQRRAKQNFRSERLRLSLALTLRAQSLADRVFQCLERGDAGGEASLDRDLERTDRFLSDTEELVRGAKDPRLGEAILADARRIQDQARRQARRGRNVGLALRLTRQARNLAARSLTIGGGHLDSEDVDQMIAGTAALVEKLDEAVGGGEGRAGKLLRRAHRLLDEARRARADGDLREAFSRARAGSSVALEVSGMVGVHGHR